MLGVLRKSRATDVALVATTWLLSSASAFAHVSVTNIGYADQTTILTFGVGHGCEGKDTVRVEVSLPESVTTARAQASAGWSEPQVITDAAGNTTKMVWAKEQPREKDDAFYQFNLRLKVPNQPFTTLNFPTVQTCRGSDGSELTTEWVTIAKPGEAEPEHPAPAVTVLPVHKSGWNKFSVAAELTDLSVFDDAEIVWAGDAAYSGNPSTAEQIKSEAGVSELSKIPAGTEIWVKY